MAIVDSYASGSTLAVMNESAETAATSQVDLGWVDVEGKKKKKAKKVEVAQVAEADEEEMLQEARVSACFDSPYQGI
jgi:ribosomal 50S subunit-recycling heat shock protein